MTADGWSPSERSPADFEGRAVTGPSLATRGPWVGAEPRRQRESRTRALLGEAAPQPAATVPTRHSTGPRARNWRLVGVPGRRLRPPRGPRSDIWGLRPPSWGPRWACGPSSRADGTSAETYLFLLLSFVKIYLSSPPLRSNVYEALTSRSFCATPGTDYDPTLNRRIVDKRVRTLGS